MPPYRRLSQLTKSTAGARGADVLRCQAVVAGFSPFADFLPENFDQDYILQDNGHMRTRQLRLILNYRSPSTD